MTIVHKTPKARREAWSYCRRCLAVMLCCVLAFGLTVQIAPRAEASVAVADVISGFVGSSASDALGSSLGLTVLNASTGISFLQSYDTGIQNFVQEYQTQGYALGRELSGYLSSYGGTVSEWWTQTLLVLATEGGFTPGKNIAVPADVAEIIRQWAVERIDFANGDVTYTQNGIFSEDSFLVFSQYPEGATYGEYYRFASLGTVIDMPSYGGTVSYLLTDKNGNTFRYVFVGEEENRVHVKYYFNGESQKDFWQSYDFHGTFVLAPERSSSTYRYLALRPVQLDSSDGSFLTSQYLAGYTSCSKVFLRENQFPDNAANIKTTLQAPANLSEPVTKDVAITIPQDVPVVDIDGVSIPAYGDLGADTLTGTGEGTDNPAVPGATPWDKVLAGLDGIGVQICALPQDIAGAITDAWPITGSIAGDQTVEQVMTEPDSLGALVITKFPFSIPWDVYKAIKLLAAPPVTPRWEVDFMEPLADNVGGFPGDTTIVIDFAEYEIVGVATRWLSTVFFIYALASGTKRLLWTA